MGAPIGRMTYKVKIQRPTKVADDAGQPQETWSDVAEVWAAVRPLATREVFASRQAEVVASHEVTIWYRADVHASGSLWRLKHGDRIWNIVSATNAADTQAPQLDLLVAEVQPWANQTKHQGPTLE